MSGALHPPPIFSSNSQIVLNVVAYYLKQILKKK